MKKAAGIILKVIAGLILLIVVLLFTLPLIFKEKIKTKVETVINSSVNATVKFDNYSLGFFKGFPGLTFSMSGFSVAGKDKFQNDTLARFKSLDLTFNLMSLFRKSGYEIKSITIDQASVNARVLKDGSANWDIMKESGTPETASKSASPSTMKVLLKKVVVSKGSLSYVDESSSVKSYINKLGFTLSGDMSMSQTDLKLDASSGEVTFIINGIKYLNRVSAGAKIDLLADLDKSKYTFRENYIRLNDLLASFSGTIAMPGKNIETDLEFKTGQSDFKSLISLIPAVYMKDYKDIKASGELTLFGKVKGVYSEADSTLPNVSLSFSVNNGQVSYPSLPEKISNINVKGALFYDGRVADKSAVDVDLFHLELAGSPFDMTLSIRTPMSDPDIKGSVSGHIDLAMLSKTVPMDSMNLQGIIDLSVQAAGHMSAIEKAQYDKFKASGRMSVKNMIVAMKGYPGLKIDNSSVEFTPAYASLTQTNLRVGAGSDFSVQGRLENYIPYMFSNKTLKGKLSMHSHLTDVSEIMSSMSSGPETSKDTTSLSLITVPKNIDFDFDALIDELRYGKIKTEKLKGHILAKDGILSIRDAGMNILGGTISMNADYNTADTLKPSMKASFGIQNIGIKDAFTTFNSVQQLAPASKGIDGKVNLTLNYESLLGKNMMPVLATINGSGKVQSDAVTLVESATFDKMKELLKLGQKYGNTFHNVNINFKINNGRIFVSPFDVKSGNLKMNISGDQGIDQTINYIVKTEIPRSELGGSVNSFIDNLSAQASSFGINFKPAEVLKVNVSVTGTFTKPVVAPFFGNTPDASETGEKSGVKETVKQLAGEGAGKAKDKASVEARAKADQIVKDAEEKGKQLRDEAAIAADKIKKEGELQAQNLVNSAASNGALAKLAAGKSADAIRKTAATKSDQLIKEADKKANKMVEEARVQSDNIIKKIK